VAYLGFQKGGGAARRRGGGVRGNTLCLRKTTVLFYFIAHRKKLTSLDENLRKHIQENADYISKSSCFLVKCSLLTAV